MINLVGARRTRSDFTKYHFAISLAVPLHVGEPGPEPERVQDLEAHLDAVAEHRVVHVAQHDRLRADPLVELAVERLARVLA